MIADHDAELLTVAEAAKVLRVSTVTLHRWLKAGRLPAYHVGPKAVRIRRGDLKTVVTPVAGGEVMPMTEAQPVRIHTSLDTIKPMTDEQQRRALDALKASQESLARQRARRGGKPFDESWPMIRAAREERSKQQL